MGAMTRFSDEAWQRVEPLRAAIHRLPFNSELEAGTLDEAQYDNAKHDLEGRVLEDARVEL